jgi:hypothetical protein
MTSRSSSARLVVKTVFSGCKRLVVKDSQRPPRWASAATHYPGIHGLRRRKTVNCDSKLEFLGTEINEVIESKALRLISHAGIVSEG